MSELIYNNPKVINGKSIDRWFIDGEPNKFWQRREYAEEWLAANSR